MGVLGTTAALTVADKEKNQGQGVEGVACLSKGPAEPSRIFPLLSLSAPLLVQGPDSAKQVKQRPCTAYSATYLVGAPAVSLLRVAW